MVLRGEVAYVEGQVLLQPGYGQNVRNWQQPLLANTSLDKLSDCDTDRQTNEEFTELLSEPTKVHFANDLPGSDLRLHRPFTSPLPGLVRHKFDSNPSLDMAGHAPNSLRVFMGKHILSVDMFNKDQLNDIFNLAETYR